MPRPETVDKAIEEISKSAANYRYFFEKLNSAAWLAPLSAKGRFSAPPEKIEVDGGILFPPWPESQYLARMAKLPQAQLEVLQIVREIPETDNIRVHADLLDIALALPAASAAQLVGRVRKWLQTPYQSMVVYKIGDLIVHLATGGQTAPALQVAAEAFALEPAAAIDEEQHEWAPSPEPQARLQDWYYDEAIKKATPALLNADKERTFALLCDLLERAVVLSRSNDETAGNDYSYIWHDAIERDEYPPRLRNTLIAAVRNAAETIIEADAEALPTVLTELRRHEWPVFKRIELHLLHQFAPIAMAEIIPIARELAAVDGSTRHEAARLLKSSFGQLPADTQEHVLQWIDAGPAEDDVRGRFELIGREPTQEALERFSNAWRAERFALFADQVPPAWRERVNDVLSIIAEPRKLDALQENTTWVGPTSPKSAAQLEEMGPSAVVAFLRTWQAPTGDMVDTPEGLGRILGEVIAADPDAYVGQAEAFRSLDPTFVRFFFSGIETALNAHRTFAWSPLLALAEWVVAQPREIFRHHARMMEADESWQWTRGAIADLLEKGLNQRESQSNEPARVPIPYAERGRVWNVLHPLLRDPDPTPDREATYGGDNMDPPTLAINTVRGKAMNALVSYALWIRSHLDRLPERSPATLDVMPEVQEALEEHLDTTHDPSLAIRSIYGQYFPWLHLLDPAWAQAAIPRIFPPEEDLTGYRAAAWDAYLQFCRPYDPLLMILEREYARALSHLPAPNEDKRGSSRRERLADHLMSFFWRGTLTSESTLITSFHAHATDELRAHAMSFVGRSLPPRGTPIEPEILDRLQHLWETRVQAAQAAENPLTFQKELSEFGWWFSSQQFPIAWSFEQLRNVITLVKDINPQYKVAEALEALAPEHPVECVQIVRLIALADQNGWELYTSEKHFQNILAAALSSGNSAAKTAADDLIQFFVTRGRFGYRALLA